MKLASFDIELSTPISEEDLEHNNLKDKKISCAAIARSDTEDVVVYEGTPELSVSQSEELVEKLQTLKREGYGIVTWNGCSFDFQILANNSNQFQECANLALSHHDLMLYVTFQKGWYLALNKALQGAGLDGKLKEVRLSDGTVLKTMSGSKAPELWQRGEKEAVINYLKQDVNQQLELGLWIQRNKKMSWLSNSGKPWNLSIKKLHSVKECFNFPLPDVSWMDNPPKRSDFVSWMPQEFQPIA